MTIARGTTFSAAIIASTRSAGAQSPNDYCASQPAAGARRALPEPHPLSPVGKHFPLRALRLDEHLRVERSWRRACVRPRATTRWDRANDLAEDSRAVKIMMLETRRTTFNAASAICSRCRRKSRSPHMRREGRDQAGHRRAVQ